MRFAEPSDGGSRAHLLVVLGAGAADEFRAKVIASFAGSSHELPRRAFILCGPGEERDWEADIKRATAAGRVKGGLPLGRLPVLSDDGLCKRLAKAGASGPDSEGLILDCYDAWIRAWKRPTPNSGPTRWDLWIGIDRSQDQEGAWSRGLRAFGRARHGSGAVRVFVRSGRAGSEGGHLLGSHEQDLDEHSYWAGELSACSCKKRALVFDKHGVCFPLARQSESSGKLSGGSRFYQRFGAESDDLFRHLQNPPADELVFGLFVFGLVEACLASVVVIDERVEADMLAPEADGNRARGLGRRLRTHQRAGIWPLFLTRIPTLDRINSGGGRSELDRMLNEALAEYSMKPDVIESQGLRQEGGRPVELRVFAPEDAPLSMKVIRVAEGQGEAGCEYLCQEHQSVLPLDVVLLHEGVLDLFDTFRGGKSADATSVGVSRPPWVVQLEMLAPTVVRTSGRGRQTRHFDPRVAFVDFSTVSRCILTSRNKYGLIRALFGARGGAPTHRADQIVAEGAE